MFRTCRAGGRATNTSCFSGQSVNKELVGLDTLNVVTHYFVRHLNFDLQDKSFVALFFVRNSQKFVQINRMVEQVSLLAPFRTFREWYQRIRFIRRGHAVSERRKNAPMGDTQRPTGLKIA